MEQIEHRGRDALLIEGTMTPLNPDSCDLAIHTLYILSSAWFSGPERKWTFAINTFRCQTATNHAPDLEKVRQSFHPKNP